MCVSSGRTASHTLVLIHWRCFEHSHRMKCSGSCCSPCAFKDNSQHRAHCPGEVSGILQRTGADIVASLSEGDEKGLASRRDSDRQARAL